MSHTPGPWTRQPDTTFSTLGDQRIVGANLISPAIVFGGIQECEANATLIAAAPDLLAELKDAAQTARNYSALFHDETWLARLTKWEAVIAQAEAGVRSPGVTKSEEELARAEE